MALLDLFTPFQLGPFTLNHRVVLAPLTRCRSYGQVPQPLAAVYYAQRATEGGLLIAEGTATSRTSTGYPHTPGIWSNEQVAAWKPIVKAVHDKGGLFFLQVWHVGRISHTYYQPEGNSPVSSTNKAADVSAILPPGVEPSKVSAPRALETDEVPLVVDEYRQAARNAMEAGFDGIEVHGAHGYLLDQFMKDGVNDRSDMYGGSLENRCRFPLQVMKVLAKEIGPERVGMRLSPFSSFNGAQDTNPLKLGVYMAKELSKLKVLYLHCVEPRMDAIIEVETEETSLPIRKAFDGTFIAAGGFLKGNGAEAIRSGKADLVAFGRYFISNPDLVERFKLDAPLTKYDRSTFIPAGDDPAVGYTDYPFLKT